MLLEVAAVKHDIIRKSIADMINNFRVHLFNNNYFRSFKIFNN